MIDCWLHPDEHPKVNGTPHCLIRVRARQGCVVHRARTRGRIRLASRSPPAMRMFIGIPLPVAQREVLARAVHHLPLPVETFRRTRPEGWHITVQFLGEVTTSQSECLIARLQEVSSAPAPVRITTLGWIGAGIVVAHVEPVPELARLVEHVTAATRLCGFQSDQRPWHPHITLARRKSRARLGRSDLARVSTAMKEAFAQTGPGIRCGFAAREFCLFESFFDPGGQRYSIRARFSMDLRH